MLKLREFLVGNENGVISWVNIETEEKKEVEKNKETSVSEFIEVSCKVLLWTVFASLDVIFHLNRS